VFIGVPCCFPEQSQGRELWLGVQGGVEHATMKVGLVFFSAWRIAEAAFMYGFAASEALSRKRDGKNLAILQSVFKKFFVYILSDIGEIC
jgi:hypothetical protein